MYNVLWERMLCARLRQCYGDWWDSFLYLLLGRYIFIFDLLLLKSLILSYLKTNGYLKSFFDQNMKLDDTSGNRSLFLFRYSTYAKRKL